jgi:hypothetical protein
MKLLLDECLPRKLKNHLPEHECSTVPEQGWAGKKNGELLLLAEKSGFEIFLTLDRGVEYEQNLKERRVPALSAFFAERRREKARCLKLIEYR